MRNECYVEVDTKQIKTNVENIIKRYPGYQYFIAVVKGNAYGHGFGVIKPMIEAGANYFAVSTLEEALAVRSLCDLPIMLLQPIALEDLKIASDHKIDITVSDIDYYKEVAKMDLALSIQLKLETGMNRLGLDKIEDVDYVINDLKKHPNLYLKGIFTHLATEGLLDSCWDDQVKEFEHLTSNIDLTKIDMVHLYSTQSLVYHPKLSYANGFRVGILMFGICPRKRSYHGFVGMLKKLKHENTKKKYHISKPNDDFNVDVKTCFKLKSPVIQIRDVKAGEGVGYGLTYRFSKDAKIAVAPIGYMDGLNLNSNGLKVKINDKLYPIVGFMNMKMITILVDQDVKVNDEVEVYGHDIRYSSDYCRVTPHFLFTVVPERIKRIYR